MTPEALEQTLDVLDVLATAGIVTASFFRFHRKQESLTVAFFCFAMVSLLLTNLYWLAHSLMRPDMRMPLSANTIGECAAFLLLSAAMNALFPDSRFGFTPQIICTVLFAASSVALWLIWSGEWLQDLLGGIAFGYFLCVCVRNLCRTGLLTRKEWIALGICCAGYMSAFLLFAEEDNHPIVTAGYIVMFATMGWFVFRAARGIWRGEDGKKQIVLSVSAYACCMSGVYMSSGYWYIAAGLICLLTLPMMLHAFGKEAETA